MARHVEDYMYRDMQNVRHYHYPSYEDAKAQSVPSYNKRKHDGVPKEGGGISWWGVKGGYGQVIRNVEEGWKEGLEIMEHHLKEMEIPRTKSARRRKVRSSQGNELDIHRVFSGNLDKAWSNIVKVETYSHNKRGKRVCVILDVTTKGVMSAEEAFWRGASAVMLVKSLMKKGYSVELNIVRIAKNKVKGPEVIAVSVCAKSFQQRMNLELVAALTSVGFYRGPLFQTITKGEEVSPSGLGDVIRYADDIPLPYFEDRSSMSIRISNIFSKHEALSFARRVKDMVY